MSVLSRPAVLLTTLSVTAGLLVAPGVAYAADTTTRLTAAEMTAAMKAVAAASTKAAASGWKSSTRITLDAVTATETSVLDAAHGRYVTTSGTQQLFAVDGRGIYTQVSDSRQRSALKMMGRTSVRYVFIGNTSVDLDDFAVTPAVVAGYTIAGSRTTHDDGSADYAVVEPEGAKVTLRVSPAGVLTGAHAALSDEDGDLDVTLAYTYGPQTVTLPAAAATIGSGTLATGVAYLGMSTAVKRAAVAGAADTRKAAKGRKVSVTTLRKIVRRDAAATNAAAGASIVKVKSITGGTRVYATNPWTRQTVSYTVKASGRKVLVKKV
ncbi:hypothetical protein AB0F81_49400 [Actinoplanes sp. NPDC024001]|uniref:hypothetical protein n=1 Tax=Actinoplanes sp. NPDC024001 TaxID=3154598 RepID=UPI003410737E